MGDNVSRLELQLMWSPFEGGGTQSSTTSLLSVISAFGMQRRTAPGILRYPQYLNSQSSMLVVLSTTAVVLVSPPPLSEQ